MGKHLKRLRAEKAKVKLKKKLPKGQNITKTAFQVKKIVIGAQLVEHVGQTLTSKHQTLQDCLNYLTHHNFQKQLDGLKGIREIVLDNIESTNSRQIRQVVAKLIDTAVEDRESKVRRASIKLLSDLLSQLSVEVQSSFVELLAKQMLRGLSNIHSDIQSDALRLIDVLLKITKNLTEIWQTISELLLRLLTMTGSKVISRLAVLKRLYAVCDCAISIPETEDETICRTPSSPRFVPQTLVYKDIAVIPLTVTIKQKTNVQNLMERIIRSGYAVLTEMSVDREINGEKLAVILLLTQFTLLFYRYASLQLNMKNWFVETFSELVCQNLLKKFPFQMIKEPSDPMHLLEVNVNLAVLFMYFRPKIDHLQNICRFIPKALKIRPVSATLILLLESLILERNYQEIVVKKIAKRCNTAPNEKLNDFLQRVAVNEDLSHIHQLPEFKDWMAGLLMNPKYANTLTKIASRRVNDRLSSTVRANKDSMLMDGNKEYLNILYWTCSHEELLTDANNLKYSENVRNYLNAILSQRNSYCL